MNWIRNQSSSAYHEFLLQEKGKTLLTLRYNEETGTLRLKTGNEKRILMLDTGQLAKNRVGFMNEYGIDIGGLSFNDGKANSGIMNMNECSYHYILRENENPGIDIYDSSDNRLLAHGTLYSLKGFNDTGVNNEICFLQAKYTPVIAGLLWYIDVKEMSTAEPA